MSVTGAIIAGVGAASSLGGAAIASHGANHAADTQAQAANQAAQIQAQSAKEALDFQKEQYATSQKELAPWLSTGTAGLANLSNLLGISPTGQASTIGADGTAQQGADLASLINPALGDKGSLAADWTGKFVAPDGITEQNDPGFKSRLAEGMKLIQNSAASRGDLLSGATAKGLIDYGQNKASDEYQNVYNRAYNQYSTDYNTFKQNQSDKFNRLASLAGVGQTAASTLGTLGQGAANNISNTLLTSGQQQANDLNNAAAARASGYASSANAWGGAVSQSGNNLAQLLALLKLQGG
jgi:hypothetical protein